MYFRLLIGTLLLMVIGIIILRYTQSGPSSSVQWKRWLNTLARSSMPTPTTLKLLALGFIFGSLAVLWLEKFIVIFGNPLP